MLLVLGRRLANVIPTLLAVVALVFAFMQRNKVLKFSEGTERMKKLAASIRQAWPLIPAFGLWVVMALILYKYWRCPKCGKTLPKTGKTFECPKCGAKID